jgi:hypothetical protein
MFGTISSTASRASARGSVRLSTRVKEVHPASQAEHDLCSYCGVVKYVAYRVASDDGQEAVACFPCSDRGMNFLEQNFPSQLT